MSLVRLENVTKRFGNVVAVDNISLEIEKGSFFSIVGPSGCGKTTTMRMTAGLEIPNSGRIWIGDRLVFSGDDRTFVRPAQRQISMVFQSYALWPHMTVYDNIAFGLQVNKVSREEIKRRVSDVLELFQIGNLADRYPNELSGGQQQRVAIARELVADREVLFMDEPLSNLDAKLRTEMRAELKRLHAETGKLKWPVPAPAKMWSWPYAPKSSASSTKLRSGPSPVPSRQCFPPGRPSLYRC